MAFCRCAFFVLLVACSFQNAAGQMADASTNLIEEAYLARDDGGKAGDETRVFKPGDIPIHCVVILAKNDPVTVKLTFVAVDVKGVRAGSKVVTASFTTKTGQNEIYFTGRPDGKWSPGKYRVDLSIGGKVERELEFEVVGSVVPAAAAAPFTKPSRPSRSRKP